MISDRAVQLLFADRTTERLPSVGLLVLRLIAGSAMALHGLPKMMTPFTWMGTGPVPGLLQFLAAFSEFAGGLALILGLFTPLAALGIAVTMLVGIAIGHLAIGDPLLRLTVRGVHEGVGIPYGGLPTWLVRADGHSSQGGSGSSELALLFAAISTVLFFVGPGRFSLDAKLWATLFAGKRPTAPTAIPPETQAAPG